MRVAYILQGFPRLSETFILREIEEMKRLGVALDIYALEDPGEPVVHEHALHFAAETCYGSNADRRDLARAPWQSFVAHPLRFCRVLARLTADTLMHPVAFTCVWRRLGFMCYFAQQIRERNTDRLHAHFAFLPADIARVIATLLNLPYSVSAHARDIHAQRAGILKRRLRGADVVATCSSDGLAALRAKIGDLTPLVLAPHGLPLTRFDGRRDEAKPPLVLAVGRLMPKKGYVHLVRACGILMREGVAFRCCIVGTGPEQDRIRKAVAEEGLEDLVELRGPLPQHRLVPLYRQAHMLVQPSVVAPDGDRDGVPNVVLESLAMGLPVIASSAGGILEVLEDGVTGLICDPQNADELAGRIRSLLDDEDQRKALGQAGRRRVVAKYDVGPNVHALAIALGVVD